MPSDQTVQEIEETLGQVPGFMAILAESASDHSWGVFRDLLMGETELLDIALSIARNDVCCIHAALYWPGCD